MGGSPIGDLHLVCMSDGIVNTFSCKKRKKIMCFDVVTENKDIMHCKQQKNRCLEIISFSHQLLALSISPSTAMMQGWLFFSVALPGGVPVYKSK